MGFLFFLILSVSSTVAAQVLLKKGMLLLGNIEFSLPGIVNLAVQFFSNIYLFLGFVFLVVSFVSWMFLLSKKDLGVVYPISSSLILSSVVIASCIFLKESFSLYQLSGIIFIVIGIFLLLVKG